MSHTLTKKIVFVYKLAIREFFEVAKTFVKQSRIIRTEKD